MRFLARVAVIKSVLMMLVTPIISVANADCFVRSRSVYKNCAPVVKQPFVQKQVIVPHKQFNVEQQAVIYVPKAIAVRVNPETHGNYTSINDYYRDKLLVDAIVGRMIQLQQQGLLAPMQQQLQKPNDQKPMPFADLPKHDASNPKEVKLAQIVQVRCISCHNDTNNKGGLSLTDLTTLSRGMRWEMHGRVASGDMPRGKKALPNEEVPPFYDFAIASSK